jgi:chemotaxis protein methyltransferase CheR
MKSDLDPAEFAIFRKFLLDSCGISLTESKQYLIQNRLAGLLKESSYGSIGELIAALGSGRVPTSLQARIIDAMTTNETFWFRDSAQFDEFKNVLLPLWAKSKSATLRIWSAAASTGQEPYSISLCVEEFLRSGAPVAGRNVLILGTDISATALAEAGRAAYSDIALSRGLPESLKARYFERCQDKWKLKSQVTARVRFQPFNLLSSFAALGKFDLIFCRNVLIYFSEDVKRDILGRMAKALSPDGYLFLSSTETLPSGLDAYETVRSPNCRYYRLPKTDNARP